MQALEMFSPRAKALGRLLKRNSWLARTAFTAHDVRRCAGDTAERAYRRGDALEKRRALMGAWAAFCEGGK